MAKRKATKKPGRQALLVLGMHRSGTSAISGLLALLGARAPSSLMEPTKDNPRGYFESVEVMKANERILSSAGSRWNDWGQFNPAWFDSLIADQERDALAEIVKTEYGTAPLLLIKDPRISRFLPLWLDVLRDAGIAPKIVIPVRHPLAVARSLEARNHFGRNRSLLLWLRHVLDAEAGSRQLPRAFVAYESVLADWQASARWIATELGVVWPKRSDDTELEVDAFLSSDLQHHAEAQEPLPGNSELQGWVRQTYEALTDACERPLEQATLDNLDRIRGEFNHSSAIYAPVVREHEKRVEGLYADLKLRLARSVEKCEGQADMLVEAERKLSEIVSTRAGHGREAGMLSSRSDVEEQSKVQQKMMDQQATLNAAAFKQEMELAKNEYSASLAEQKTLYAKAQQDHQEVLDRLQARDAEVVKLREDGQRSEAAAAEYSRQLAEKVEELAHLRERVGTMASESAIASTGHQSALQNLQEQLLERDEEVATLSGQLSQLKSSIDAQSIELHRALSAAETSAKVRFRETAKLTEMLFQKETATEEQASRIAELTGDKREVTLLEYRNAVIHSTLSRRLDACQHQSHIYAQALSQVGSSRAWRLLSRVQKIRLPPVQEPEVDVNLDTQVELLRSSDLFDARWYLERYPDVAESGLEPERHYLLIGAPAGYNPGPEFDSVAYLMEYPDVLQAAVDPLVHYLEHGEAEARTRTAPVEARA